MGYRAIIADDEPKILKLVRMLGHWEEYGIEIVCECHDGKETLESILREKPDFVISDIKMPDLDGLEMIEAARKNAADCLFVLISGYRHFEYAQSAIALNVVDYLLKPIEEEQLNRTLEKLCRQCDQRELNKAQQKELQQFRSIQSQQLMDDFWRDYHSRKPSASAIRGEDINSINQKYGTSFVPGLFQVINVVTNISETMWRTSDILGSRVDMLFGKCFEKCASFCVSRLYGGYELILNYPENMKRQVQEGIRGLFFGLKDLRELYGDFRLNIGVSSVSDKSEELLKLIREARAAEWGRLVIMNDSVLEYSQIASLKQIKKEEIVSAKELSHITDCVKYLRKQELGELFSEIHKRAMTNSNCNPAVMADIFFDLLEFAADGVSEGNREELIGRGLYAFSDARNFPQVTQKLYLQLEEYIEAEEKKASEKIRKPIIEAVSYVRAHYMEPISAEDVATASHVSATYLSRLFKEEMDTGFLDFLTQVRLEEAQKLLSDTNLSIKEIAGKIGYPDEKYFSKLFKKITGLKPSEYRRIYG